MDQALPPHKSLKSASQNLEDNSQNHGFVFWRNVLKRPRLVVAPMVDASELAWRLLSRRYGADLCFSPMLHSAVLAKDLRYQRDSLRTCPQDRPLIVQLCANDPEVLSEACRLASPHCDAIDINLGCPQSIAKRGGYGAFLMEDLDLIKVLVEAAVKVSSVPVTAKIRIFPEVEKTVKYAQMLEAAGASIITVHARTRDQKGPKTGLADWSYISAVRKAVSVPVFANGNIQNLEDVQRCLTETGVQGVMSAETNLHNPAFFMGPLHFSPDPAPTVWRMGLEYLELAKEFPCPLSFARGHVFKILHHCLQLKINFGVRDILSKTNSLEEMKECVEKLSENMLPYYQGEIPMGDDWQSLPIPPWFCQPYVRVPFEVHQAKAREGEKKRKVSQTENGTENGLDGVLSENSPRLSKRQARKLLKNPNRSFEFRFPAPLCPCKSPRGIKCEFELCKNCCRSRCYQENLDCPGHRVWIRRNRQRAKEKSLEEGKIKEGEGICLQN